MLLPDAFPETRLKASLKQESARAARARAAEAIAELDRQIAQMIVPEELLAQAEAIESLREGLAADRKARARSRRRKQDYARRSRAPPISWPSCYPRKRRPEPMMRQRRARSSQFSTHSFKM